MGLWEYPAFAFLGLGVGAYGTLVGLGGGIVIVPVLLLVYQATPQATVGTSLAVIFLNTLSGTLAYLRQRRVDLRSGVRFAAVGVPGAVLGAYLSTYLTSRLFSLAFGLLLIGASVFLVWRPERQAASSQEATSSPENGQTTRTLVDSRGNVFAYTFNERIGILVSFLAGLLSGILGIGGGIIYVPTFIQLLAFPTHVAVATAYFIQAITTGVGAASHLALGNVMVGPALSMAVGAVVGAQIGAALARRLQGGWVVRFLSLALMAAGARLVWGGLAV